MVFYDGEYLCVQMNRNLDYDVVLDLAKQADYSQYISEAGIYCLPPTKRNARVLKDNGYTFDDSAKMFLTEKKADKPKYDEALASLYPFQREGVERILSTDQNWLIADEMGCVDGDAFVLVRRDGKYLSCRLCEFYERFTSEKEGSPWFIRCLCDGRFGYGEVIDVLYSGVKDCIMLCLDNGTKLTLTKDHLVKSECGWLEAKDSMNMRLVTNPTFSFLSLREVVGIREVGPRPVYDVKVLDHSNFMANRVIVHNCGKTVQALAYLKMNPKSLPALVICPASLKLNWAKEITKWTGLQSYVISGRTPEHLSDEFLEKYPIWVMNYDIVGFEDKDEKEQEEERKQYCKENGLEYRKRKLKVHGWCDEIARHRFSTIVCDEVQYIAEPSTLRSRGVIQICKGDSRKIFLSGTPYETKTSQFFTCLHILDSGEFPYRWGYLMQYCNPKKTRFGWQFNGLSNAEELHEKIGKVMIRRLKKNVLSQLPPKTRIVVPMDVTKAERKVYDDAEREMDRAMASGEKNALSKLAELKKASFQAKKYAVMEWIRDYLQVNDKLVVFVYHRMAFELLMQEFSKIAVGINGDTPNAFRQEYVDRFQTNPKTKLFIGQIKATNAGLTLTASSATCFVEFPMSYPQAVQCEDRVHRISQEADAVFAYYLVLDDSIDNTIMEVIDERAVNINKVMDNTDSSLFGEETDFNKRILEKYSRK